MNKRRILAIVGMAASAVLVATSTGIGTASAGQDDSGDPITTPPMPRFVTKCTFSHRAADDPIVKPGQPGASHSHDFFGNVTTNAFSNLKRLKAGGTTCMNQLDRSGYWVPSLFVDGALVDPTFTNVYYQSAGKPVKRIKPIPKGLKVVAGDSTAMVPQSKKIVSWDCSAADTTVPNQASIPTCPQPTLTVHVNFPDCWNGINLDSADHKSHLAYHNADGTCPAGFPVPIPRVRVNVHYPTVGGPTAELSSIGQLSGHADFFNAWDPKELRRLIKTCIKANLACNAKASV
jgi:hypothetical protein